MTSSFYSINQQTVLSILAGRRIQIRQALNVLARERTVAAHDTERLRAIDAFEKALLSADEQGNQNQTLDMLEGTQEVTHFVRRATENFRREKAERLERE